MENKEDTEKTAIQGKEEPPTKETNVVTEKVDTEEKKDVKKIKETVEEKAPEIGGIAGLLGKTACILGALVQKEEEEAPKISLPAEDVETYKAAFNDFDHNKDGHISTQVFYLNVYLYSLKNIIYFQDLHLSLRRA